MISFFKKKRFPNLEQVAIYTDLCLEASRLLGVGGKNVKPFEDASSMLFLTQPEADRVIENLRAWVDAMASAIDAGESLNDDKKILWRILKRLKYTPTSDLLDNIHDGDTVEIYTTDNWQVYRNLRFFNYLDVTVDEICNFNWSRDTKRDAKVSLEALRLVFLMKTKQLKKTFFITSIPPHLVTAVLSNTFQKISIDLKIASPLWNESKEIEAYIVTNKCERLSPA